MKQRLSSTAYNELCRLVTDASDTTGLQRLATQISALPPATVHDVETVLRCLPHIPMRKWGGLWLPATYYSALATEIAAPDAPALMFSHSGIVREAALKALDPLPDTPFFLAALAWRLNDWAEPVRRAAEDCISREAPRLSTGTVAGAAPFLLERMLHWGRWRSPPPVLLDALARPDAMDGLVDLFATTADMPASVLRGALRLGLLDNHLLAVSRTAVRPELRAVALRAMLNGEAAWVTHYERTWEDKRYGRTRRVPVLARRQVPQPAALDALIRQGAADRSPLVRRAAANGLVQHAAGLGDIQPLISLFDGEKSPSVRWYITYLAERGGNQSGPPPTGKG
jgi:hypothetical protein